jgi:type II restriction enzyme
MDLHLDEKLGLGYSSNSQKSRVITEGWTEANLYCPVCGAPLIEHYTANKPVADFYCPHCHSDFEQKSIRRKTSLLPRTVEGGAYEKMKERLTSDQNPNLLVMTYTDGMVRNLLFIPKHFFTMSVVKKRNPLKPTARRAGWIGSHILLADIPDSGRIYIVKDGIEQNKIDVLTKYKMTLPLKAVSLTKRGWLLDVLKCVESIPTKEFALTDVYDYIPLLEKKHPGNSHIKDKIRQQLQVLRDKGFIVFVAKGQYRKVI